MSTTDPLTVLRWLWRAFVVGVVAIAAAGTVLTSPDTTVPVSLSLGLAAAVGVATFVGVTAIHRLFGAEPPADDAAALTAYRARLVIQAALAEAGTLLTAVLAAVVGPRWTATIGGAAAVAALVAVRPSLRRFERLDQAWAAAGADVSLRRAVTAGATIDQEPSA